jgi:hypothetical protein
MHELGLTFIIYYYSLMYNMYSVSIPGTHCVTLAMSILCSFRRHNFLGISTPNLIKALPLSTLQSFKQYVEQFEIEVVCFISLFRKQNCSLDLSLPLLKLSSPSGALSASRLPRVSSTPTSSRAMIA